MSNGSLKQKVVSGMIWKFLERFTSQLVSFIVSLVLARLLSPSDYGAVSIILVFITLADVLLTSGLSSGLIQKEVVTDLDFSTIFWVNLLFSICLYGILFLSAPLIASAYRMEVLTPAIRVFALRLPFSAFQAIQISYVSRRMDFKRFFWATLVGTLTSGVIGIIMAIAGFGVWALIFQYLFNTAINSIALWFIVRWSPRFEFSIECAKPLISYGWKVMATDFLGTICNNLGGLLIGFKYSSADLGFYTKGKQLPELVRSNLYNTLISVLFPAISKVNNSKEKTKALLRKSVKTMSYIVFPIMFGLIAAGETVIDVLFTSKWLPMYPFVVIMCVETLISIVATITLQGIKATGRSDLMLKAEVGKKIFLVISTLIAMQINVIAIALILPLNAFVDWIINGFLTGILIGYSPFEQLYDCLEALMLSSLMAIAVWLLSLIGLGGIMLLLIQIVAGAGIYILASRLIGSSSFNTLIALALKYRDR